MAHKKVISNNHFTISSANSVYEICQPLFTMYGINACIYGRFFDDGSCYMLTSCREWHIYHFSKEYMITAPIPPKLLSEKFYYLISKNDPYAQVLHDARNLFGYDHIIDLIQVHNGYYDMFSFASSPQNESILNFYLNNINILEQFTLKSIAY